MPRITSYYRKRKGSSRGERKVKKPRKLMQMSKVPSMPVYRFNRRWYANTYTWNTAAVTGFWNVLQMAFNQIPSNAEYSALFYEYKINAITVTFVPRYTSTDQTSASTGSASPMLHWKVETPQFLAPVGAYNSSTLNAYLDTGATSQVFDKPISVTFKPTIATDVNNAVVETSVAQWLRTTSPGNAAVHSGISFWVLFNGFTSPTATFTTDVYYEFDFSLRNSV